MSITTPPLTPDGAEMELLADAAKNGIVAHALGAIPNTMLQLAHERLVLNEHLRLIDITIIMNTHTRKPEPGRVFKITESGRKRLMDLRVSAK